MDNPKTTVKLPSKPGPARKKTSPLSPSDRQAIQAMSKEMSIREVARRLNVSRPTIYRWLARQDTAEKSRRPKSAAPELPPIQRDAVGEIVRLTRLPRAKLLPSILQAFPFFGCLTPNGQRRVWSTVLDKAGCLSVPTTQNAIDSGTYASRFRIGALWLGDARHPDRLVCCLLASEEASGFIMHRVVDNGKVGIIDFVQDLFHEWQLSVSSMPISHITMLTGPDLVFPDRALQDQSRTPRISWEQLRAEVNQDFAAESVPILLHETLPTRPRTLWLCNLTEHSSLVRAAKQLVRTHLAKYNLWNKEQDQPRWSLHRDLSPLDNLKRRAKLASNSSEGDVATEVNFSAVHLFASRPLAHYSKQRRDQKK